MDRIVDAVTDRLVNHLPESKSYYLPQDLLQSGVPPFLVERVTLELKQYLEESVDPPDTQWVDMSTEQVQLAWASFLEAIRSQVRVPSGHVHGIITNAVADVLEVLVEPRKQIPARIFGDKDQLTYDELITQLQWLVVYPHFSQALISYMKKKNLDSISRSRCEYVIQQVDDKLIERYQVTGWQHIFEPWFELMDRKVSPDLLVRFFEDKNWYTVARRFDQQEEDIDDAKLLSMIDDPDSSTNDSSADSRADGDHQKEADSPSGYSAVSDKTTDDAGEDVSETETLADEQERSIIERLESIKPESPGGAQPDESETGEEEAGKPEKPEVPWYQQYQEQEDSEAEETDSDEDASEQQENEEVPWYQQYQEHEESETEETDSDEDDLEQNEDLPWHQHYQQESKEETRFADIFSDNEHQDEEDGSDEDVAPAGNTEEQDANDEFYLKSEAAAGEDETEEAETEDEAVDSDESESEDIPMWRRFAGNDEQDDGGDQEETSQWIGEDDEEPESPIIDLSGESNTGTAEYHRLMHEISDVHQYFIDELFGGDEPAFERAMEHIATFNTWKEAVKFISQEVFRRNMVDMYSDVAVEFTDRMQNYFLQKSK